MMHHTFFFAAAETAPLWILDVGIFVAFLLAVVFVGIFMSRRTTEGRESESYFLAGRGLGWWLIGFSLIAANISTEQFVGMSGDAASYVGLAIASFEWLAAVSLVLVAFFFLPSFLKTGIYTIPQFLEKRYNRFSRTLMSLLMVVILITVSFAAVVYSGAMTFEVLFKDINLGPVPLNLLTLSYAIGFVAMLYVACGGLKACAWADLIQGSALIAGGGIILYFALRQLGIADPNTLSASFEITPELSNQLSSQNGWERFQALNVDKLRMNLSWDDPKVPVTALFFALWIPNLYYWGLNQYIVQRTLGAQSLAQGQKGMVFAAFMKLLIPFIVIFPGMIAFNLFRDDLKTEATLPKDNGGTIAKFLEKQAAPQGSLSVFDFNKDYAKLYPAQAEDILDYNLKVLGLPATESGSIMSRQQAVLAKVREINTQRNRDAWEKRLGRTPPEEPLPPLVLEKQLIGYRYDSAFPLLVGKLIPPGFRGFILAAVLGAVISSLASVLNAASTVTSIDLYKEYINPKASEKRLVFIGRVSVVVFALIGCTIALFLGHPRFKGIFTFIQEFQGFISPGILAAFIFGIFARYAPRMCGPIALLGSPIIYGALMIFANEVPYLTRMAITFGSVVGILGFLTAFFPLKEPFIAKAAEGEQGIDLRSSRSARFCGILVILATLGLYLYFWKYDWAAFGNYFVELFFKILA